VVKQLQYPPANDSNCQTPCSDFRQRGLQEGRETNERGTGWLGRDGNKGGGEWDGRE